MNSPRIRADYSFNEKNTGFPKGLPFGGIIRAKPLKAIVESCRECEGAKLGAATLEREITKAAIEGDPSGEKAEKLEEGKLAVSAAAADFMKSVLLKGSSGAQGVELREGVGGMYPAIGIETDEA